MSTQAGHSSRIFSTPTGATIRVNGRILGTTTPSGLVVLWQLGDRVTVEKSGFQTATLVFSYPSEKKEITIELTRAARESEFPNRVVHRTSNERVVHQQTRSEPPKIAPNPFKGKHFSLKLVGLVTLLPLLLGFCSGAYKYFTTPRNIVSPVLSSFPALSNLAPFFAHPPSTEPPRACNTVLASHQKIDSIIEVVEYVLKFTNDERAQWRLPPLQSGAGLAFIAQNHAENMCDSTTLENDSPVFPNDWRLLAERLKLVGLSAGDENIGLEKMREPETLAKHLVKFWMVRESSRQKILDGKWRNMGIGICPCSAESVYAVQVFSDKPGGIR